MMMILEVNEGSDIELMPEELQKAINSVRGEFAEGLMIGTQAVDGKQLVFVNVNASREEAEGLFVAFDLDWNVLAVENEIVDQSLLLPYFLDVPVLDEEGEQVGIESVTDLTDKLQVWAGKSWIYA